LIDDSEAQSSRIKATLESWATAWSAPNRGVEGLRLARMSKPDLMLLDVVMDDIDGFAVCRWLKMDAETRDIR